MTRPRDTFLSTRDLIVRAMEHSSKIEQCLGALHGVDGRSRTALLRDTFQEEQAKLTSAFERYLQEATPSVLDTFAQASVAIPELCHEPAAPVTADSLTEWMLNVNKVFTTVFSEAADAVEATPAHPVFENLATRVHSHEMRIAQSADGASDM